MDKKYIEHQYDLFHEVYTANFQEEEMCTALFYKMFDFDLVGKKVLDIGCGDGIDLQVFQKRGALAFGLDPSGEFLKKACKNNPFGTFKEGIGEQIPWESAVFDVVISKWALQTSSDVPAVLRETARVVKKGGVLIFLSKHPILQYLQKIRDFGHGADYYKQVVVTSHIFSGKITLKEPSHTMGEYLSDEFLRDFNVVDFVEATEFPASEQLDGDTYPTFFIVKAIRR